MKETELHIADQTQQVAEQRKEFKKSFSMRIMPGHSVFSLNQSTGEIEKVEVQKTAAAIFNGKFINENRAYQKAGFLYIGALNQKNAEKKFRKFIQYQNRKSN